MNKIGSKKVIIVLVCAVVFLTQCNKKIVEQPSVDIGGETIDVSLWVDDGNDSKTEIYPSGIVMWKQNDKIYVVGSHETDGGLLGYMTAQNDGASAYFTGTIRKTTQQQDFHFYYVGDNEFTLDGNNYTYNISQQNGKLGYDVNGIAKKLQLMHCCIKSVKAGTTNLGNISMTSMMSIINLKFSRTDSRTLKTTAICKGAYSSMTFNVKYGIFDSDGNPISGVTRNIGEIILNNITVDGVAVENYYMSVIPGDQALEFVQSFVGVSYPSNNFLVNKLYNGGSAKSVDMEVYPYYIPGEFSVSGETKVLFSKGNIQWSATNGTSTSTTHLVADGSTAAGTWRFAEHQYDYVGNEMYGNVYANSTKCDNSQISNNYNGWIDLFGWGTSGYNGKNPYMISTQNADYGNGANDIAATNYDWGVYNDFDNDGTLGVGAWRTFTYNEWKYLIGCSPTASISSCRTNAEELFGSGKVGDVYGLILLPDDWETPSGLSFQHGMNDENHKNWNDVVNKYTFEQWGRMEAAGAVFLPAGGYRSGTTIGDIDYLNGELIHGYYWSCTANSNQFVYYPYFKSYYIEPCGSNSRSYGYTHRLVRNLP